MKTFRTAKGTELPLLNLKGKDYLQVMHRLVWFREERPTWAIETELLRLDGKSCVARAVIKDDQGRIIATAHKSETESGFPDFIEKSETGATGRALALCGYGTQFCAEELEEGERLADSPVARINPVRPDQPGPEDGNTESFHYKIPFGKWNNRTLEEVFQNHGDGAIQSYIQYLEDSAQKKGKLIDGVAAEFIARASAFIAAMEQNWAKEARE
jgi:hypothetical protein